MINTNTLPANDLPHRARLQIKVSTDDTMGGKVISYSDVDTIWCNISMQGGQAFYEAKKINPKLTHFIVMRWRRGVNPLYRIVWDGRAFQIDSVDDPDGKHIQLHALATEIVQYGV